MGFISKDQDTTSNFQPFDAGPQKLEITGIEKKQTKAKNGSYLALELTVAKGKQKGRKVWHNLNLDNPSVDAVEIAKKEAMQMVIQIKGAAIDIKSEDHLIKILKGGLVNAQIKIRKSKEFGDKNEVAYFIMPEDAAKGTGSSKPGAGEEPDQSVPPWEQQEEKSTKKDKKKKKKKKKSKE